MPVIKQSYEEIICFDIFMLNMMDSHLIIVAVYGLIAEVFLVRLLTLSDARCAVCLHHAAKVILEAGRSCVL